MSARRNGDAMPRRTSPRRRRQTRPTVEQLVDRLDELGRADAGYRRLTLAVRRALRRMLSLLGGPGRDAYMVLETALNARDVYSTDAVAQWAYSLGVRDGATPIKRVRVRIRAVERIGRLREAQR